VLVLLQPLCACLRFDRQQATQAQLAYVIVGL